MSTADDARRWSEIGDAIRTMNATFDGPPPMKEIARIATKHSATSSDILTMQRIHRQTGRIELPADVSPYTPPRIVDLAGLDRLDDLTHEAPDLPRDVGPLPSADVACDRCGRTVRAKGLGSHQRGPNCTPPETAGPDTTVQASAPPAVTEDEPTPPAYTVDPPGRIDIQFPMTPAAVHEVAGIMADLDAGPERGTDRLHVDAALANVAEIVAAHEAGPVAESARTALAELELLQDAIRDHHRTADLVAELAAVEARAAEIKQALGHDAAAPAAVEDPQLVACECGEQVKQFGMGPHRARSKAHAAWVAARGGAA